MNQIHGSAWARILLARWMLPLLALWTTASASSQGLAQGPAVEAKFIGIGACQRCHIAPTEADVAAGSTHWVSLKEFKLWNESDKHARSFELLTMKRGQEIGRALWNDPDVTQRHECISCHCNWSQESHKPERFDRGVKIDYELSKGVTCESCHGPGSLYEKEHTLADWREKTNEEKRDKWGMVNVRDPRERAQRCLSCHIGNAAEGKLLTHEMYAAGHPPLPGIEIETFAHNMPPHWRYLNQKPADLPKLTKIRELLAQPDGELHGVKSVLVGGLMNLRESVSLVGQQSTKPKEGGPEFALFDCAMCHHELRTPSWRQARMLSGRLTPGRPQLHRWPAALVDAALVRAAGGDAGELTELRKQFTTKQGALQAIFNKSPFGVGRGNEIAAASGELVQWLDAQVADVSAARYDRPACEALLKDLCGLAAQNENLDYDSARQVAWALRSIWHELNPPPGGDARVSQVLAELTATLRLDLPWGQKAQILDPDNQKAAFEAVSDYQPASFQKQVQSLSAALGAATSGPKRP